MLSREQILNELLRAINKNENMLWVLAALKMNNRPIQKEQLKEMTNALFMKQRPEAEELPIRSRHLLDEAAAMLEGAALVHVAEVAKSKQYTLSDLGNEVLYYRQQVAQRKEV